MKRLFVMGILLVLLLAGIGAVSAVSIPVLKGDFESTGCNTCFSWMEYFLEWDPDGLLNGLRPIVVFPRAVFTSLPETPFLELHNANALRYRYS